MSYLRLEHTDSIGDDGRLALIYADAKADVPATGALTAAELGLKENLVPGSKVYTSDKEWGILKDEDDEWNWGS